MSLLNKLIKVEYELSVYDKNNNLIETFDLSATVENIKLILTDEQNFSTSVGIQLNIIQLNKLKVFMKKQIDFDSTRYDYYLLETGLYNWENKKP